MSTSGSGFGSGSSTPSTHPSDDEWEEVSNASPLSGIEAMESNSTVSDFFNVPSQKMVARLSAIEKVFLCVGQHIDWTKNPEKGSQPMLIEVIRKALYDYDFKPTDIVDYISKTPRSLPRGEELFKLKELSHARDRNGKQYGEKRPALDLCEEVMNLCIDVYLDTDSSPRFWKEEIKGINCFPQREEAVDVSPLPGNDVKKPCSAAICSFKEPPKAGIAKLSAMQNVFLLMKVHVDPSYQKPLTRKTLLEYITVALYDHDLQPSDIVNYIGKTPHSLPKGEELKRWRLLNQCRDRNGIPYGEKRPEALNLCEEVMNLCIDVYLDVVSLCSWEEKTKCNKDASSATTHTTASMGKGKAMEVKTKSSPTQEFMKHATPPLTSSSYHPAKLQTCVPPLKKANKNVPQAPKIMAPRTVSNTAAAKNDTNQDLLTMAKEIHAGAESIKKRLDKSAFAGSIQQPLRKPNSVQYVVSHVETPSTCFIFKGENRPLYAQSKQRKSTCAVSRTSGQSITSRGLDNESVKPIYSRSGEKEASLWKANMIYANHGLPTHESFAQQLSDQHDNPPIVYEGGKPSASLWSKSNKQSAFLANEPKLGDVVKDGKVVVNALDLDRHADITAGASARGLAAFPLRQKVVGKTDSVESDAICIAEFAKANVEERTAEALTAFIPSQKFQESSLPAANVHGSSSTYFPENGKPFGNTFDQKKVDALERGRKRFTAFEKGKDVALAALTPTQRFEKTLADHVGSKIHSSMYASAGYFDSHSRGDMGSIKHERVSDPAAKKDAAPKAMNRIKSVTQQFEQGPVMPPTKGQFEGGRLIPPKKKSATLAKKEVRRATWTQNGDDESAHLVKIAMVPVGLLVLCTFIQITMKLSSTMSIIFNIMYSCLSQCMDYTGDFLFGVWWLIGLPLPLFGYINGFIGGLVNQSISIRPAHTAITPNASPLILEPGSSTISAMQEAISLWDALGAEKSKSSQCENSLQISFEISANSPNGIRYRSDHSFGNGGWMMYSDYPFTRHNNSIPEADRCEHFVKSFQYFWAEEMEEKKYNEGDEGRFDLALGNELAEVLSKYCK